MAAKQLCALVSVAILAALGLITIMLGGLPGNQTVAATTPPLSFSPDESLGAASAQPVAVPALTNESVRTSSGQGRLTRTTPVRELLDDETTIAAPITPNYGSDDPEYDRLSRMP